MKKSISAVVVASMLVGCETSLKVKPDGSGAFTRVGSDNIALGAVYSLPILQFKLAVTRTLSSCGVTEDSPNIQFRFDVKAEPHYIAGDRFVLDYQALSSWSKAGSVEMQTYDNGVLKSINGSAIDESASIIGDVVSTGFNIARLVSGIPVVSTGGQKGLPPPGSPPPELKYLTCTEKAQAALKAVDELTTIRKAKNKALADSTDELAALARLAELRALTDADKVKLKKLQSSVKEQSNAIESLNKAADAALAKISTTEEVIWPESANEFGRKQLSPNKQSTVKLNSLFELSTSGAEPDEVAASQELSVTLSPLAVVRSEGCATDTECKQKENYLEASNGVYFRSPVPAMLYVCGVSSPDSCKPGGATAVILSNQVMAPQLGILRQLPLSNGIFQNNALSASFREDGSLSSIKYEEKSARGKALTGAIRAGVSAYGDYREDSRSYRAKVEADALQRKKDMRQATLDKLDFEKALAEKQKAVELAKKPGDPTLLQNSAEVTRIESEIAVINARKQLEELKKPATP